MRKSFETRLQHLAKGRHVLRRRPLVTGSATSYTVDGRDAIDFCSNDYLGMSTHPMVIEAAQRAAKASGVGSTGSPYVSGYTDHHQALEQALAQFLKRDKALLFSSGYVANLAVLTALTQSGDRILVDRLSHASLIDACTSSEAKWRRFHHGDITDLERKYRQLQEGVNFIVTDGVFSMDGDVAPLAGLARFAATTESILMVDDAHGLGVCGPCGAGSVLDSGLDQEQVPIMTGTLGKSLGAGGAFVAGPKQIIEAIAQQARPVIYSTSLPVPIVAAAKKALQLITEQPQHLQRLHANIRVFRDALAEADLGTSNVDGPIQPLIVGAADKTAQLSERLLASGYFVQAIRPPTVPDGTSRLRITLSARHTESQIAGLVAELKTQICQREQSP